jgi:hypothetical protein
MLTLSQSSPTPADALAWLRALAAPGRFRVIRDAEGWPLIPGRLGSIEWYDAAELAVSTDRPRLFTRLWALPGVRPWQTGDREMRALFPPAALPAVAGVIRARRRRIGRRLTPEQAARLRAGARHRAASAA